MSIPLKMWINDTLLNVISAVELFNALIGLCTCILIFLKCYIILSCIDKGMV